MNNFSVRETDILVSLRREKKQLNKELRKSQARITDTTRDIFGEVPKTGNRVALFTNLVGNGMAIYQGVRIGNSLIRTLSLIFRKRRK